jgi:hypothetical protein
MHTMQTRPADNWTPQYFLAALGYGGLAVTFFVWLYMWVPHPGQAVPVFEDIAGAWAKGNPAQQVMIAVAMAAIAVLSLLHYRSLIWNLSQFANFKRTHAYEALLSSNAKSQLLGLPLALAMSINTAFVIGLVFVPGLWSVVEYLFPFALVAFLAVGVMALRTIGAFLGRISTKGGFDWSNNGSFAQVQPAFALGMIGVGMSAPAALTTSPLISGIALMLATFFFVVAVLYAVLAVIMGISATLQHGVTVEGIPTLMNIVPLTTVLGILLLRQNHSLHSHFGVHGAPGDSLLMLTQFLSVEVAFLLFGWVMMRKHGYMSRFVWGNDASAGSYGLICPGVGIGVMMQFWINSGLVGAGLVAKFSVAYWALSGLAVLTQVAMIVLVIALNRKHFGTRQPVAVPAE